VGWTLLSAAFAFGFCVLQKDTNRSQQSTTTVTPDQDAVVSEIEIAAPPVVPEDYSGGWPGVVDAEEIRRKIT
jgi:hypothetical protein